MTRLAVRAPQPRTVDALLAITVAVVLSVIVTADQASPGSIDPVAYLWAVSLGLLMLVRRTMPRLVLGLTVLGYFSYYAAGLPAIGVAVPIAAALYTAAEAGYVRLAVLTSVLVVAVSTGFRLLVGQSAAFVLGYELVGHVALIAAVIALGYSVRAHRSLQRKTEQVARLTAHQARLQAERAAHEDRARLSRELHDSIGHALSVASLHTSVAREADDSHARAAALRLVSDAVSDAMVQLRSTVSLLRSATSAVTDAPTTRDLGRLLDAPAAAGYDVELDVAEVSLAAEVDEVAFRLVQEAVTNTLRHSAGSRISVVMKPVSADRLVVAVSDDGGPGRSPRYAPGHGLAGMRERVESVGGRLAVFSDSDGWHVTASLPHCPKTQEERR
ncbi:MAG TPA: histidine kinase [Nocardioides sp.]|nr:histidine kinase [Nocardioides sp.]